MRTHVGRSVNFLGLAALCSVSAEGIVGLFFLDDTLFSVSTSACWDIQSHHLKEELVLSPMLLGTVQLLCGSFVTHSTSRNCVFFVYEREVQKTEGLYSDVN
jgi:hypothetical protein